MTSPNNRGDEMMSEDQIAALKAAAEGATPGDLDSAEIITVGEITCPLCGDGTIDHKTFTNIDGQVIGVEVFGVGEKMADYEMFARLANPAAVLSLIEERETAKDALEDLQIEYGHAKREALDLAVWLHKTYYADVTDWKPFKNASSLLTQIDNMVAGVRNKLVFAESRIAELIAEREADRATIQAQAQRIEALEGALQELLDVCGGNGPVSNRARAVLASATGDA